MAEIKTISVLPPSSKDKSPELNAPTGPLRDKNKILTRAGMEDAIKRNGSVLLSGVDPDKPDEFRTYTRIQDLPTDEQIAAYAKHRQAEAEKGREAMKKSA